MNTYDPMDRIVYRHLGAEAEPPLVRTEPAIETELLPSGYANGSPRTYLGRTRRPVPAESVA